MKITTSGGWEKCPHCDLARLYGYGMCDPRHILHAWTKGTKVYLDLHRQCWKGCDCCHTPTSRGKISPVLPCYYEMNK